MKNKKLRIGIVILDIVLILALFIPCKYTKDFYLNVFMKDDEHLDYNSYITNLQYYTRSTFIAGMYGVHLNSVFSEPATYDENVLKTELEKFSADQTATIGKPNILVVFDEAFFDIDSINEFEFNVPLTANFNKLKSEGKFANLLSPAYGGMSENVAFEFLTGANMSFFPKGYIPIMSFYDRKNSRQYPSLVKVLNENNYDSKIIFGKDYYLSEDAYTKMGFNEYIELADVYLDTEQTTDGKDPSDIRQNVYDKLTDGFCIDFLIDKLENKPKDKKAFYLLETIEGHMPYYKDKFLKYDVSITKSNLSELAEEVVTAYAQGVYDADKELGRLYEYIKTYEEPTIVLFLGDHLPYMYNTAKNYNALDEIKYFNTNDALLNEYRIHNTQVLVLANFDISNMEWSENLELDNVLNSVVNQMDVKISEPYYKWLYTQRNTLINRNVVMDKDGKLVNTREMPEEVQKIYNLRHNMQYEHFMKY